MLMLKVLLGLFPRPFRERFGEEWMDVSQQLLDRGPKIGWNRNIRAWTSLCSDVALQAPAAHVKEVWKAVVGMPPVLAGAGVLGGTWLLAKHWGGRPAMALGRGLLKYAWGLGAGGVFAMGLHEWLEQRAWVTVGGASQVGVNANSFSYNPQSLIVVVGIPLVAVMLAAGWPRLKIAIKAITINQSLGSLLAFLLGFYLVLTSILLGQLREVSNDAISDFILYPQIVGTPVERLSSDNPEEWTAEQKQWFDPAYPWTERLLPEKKEEWCAIKQAQLNTWHKTIVSRNSSSMAIALLLWQATRTTQYLHGCMDETTWLKGHEDAAFSIQQGTGLLHHTWEPLAAIHPLADRLLLAHHVVWPQLVMSPQKYCLTTAQIMVEPGHVVDVPQLNAVCNALITTPEKELEHTPRRAWWGSLSEQARRDNLKLKPLTETQRKQIRHALESSRHQWQSAWTPHRDNKAN